VQVDSDCLGGGRTDGDARAEIWRAVSIRTL
jgi:hypothetical protein